MPRGFSEPYEGVSVRLPVGQTGELTERLQVSQHDPAGRAVSMLGDNNLRYTLIVGVRVVVLVTVEEHHHVGEFFDGLCGLEAGEPRAFIVATLQSLWKPGEYQHWNTKLSR